MCQSTLYHHVMRALQVNELVLGNVDGVLAVFKGRSTTPLKKCSGLGAVSG